MQTNRLARDFSFATLLKFAFPTIVMMVFMSLYTMVDGVFVSRFVGTSALSAVNIVYPLINVVYAVAVMLATGGSAIIARKMGENLGHEACENFTFITLVGAAIGLMISVFGFAFIDPMLRLLGANEAIYHYCYRYAFILLIFVIPSIFQLLFQYFLVTAGRPTLGLILTAAGGIANIVLDYVFIVPLDMGIGGAALATGIGYTIPAVASIVFFARNKGGTLYFARPKIDLAVLAETCLNGASEMVTNFGTAVITLMFNVVMMRLVGEDGVAAVTIILYAEYLLVSVFLGYASGVAPVISYKYGSENIDGLQNVFKISMKFILMSSVAACVFAYAFAGQIVSVFASAGTEVYAIGLLGFRFYAPAFLLKGVNIFASSLFTALSNGRVSAILSFMRTFLFIAAGILILPIFLGIYGVWLSVPLAEVFAIIMTAFYLVQLRATYRYY